MWTETYYDNTVAEWAIAFGIILGSFLVARALYWIINRYVKKITEKTNSRLDDILIDMLEEPLRFAIIIAGIWYGLETLNLSEVVIKWIDKAYYILIIITIAWFVSRLLDAIIEEYLAPKVVESKGDLGQQLLPVLRKGVRATIWILAIIIGLDNAGYDVGAIIAGLGIGGLAFALAAQDTVKNLFGGVTIFTDKPFTINDRVIVHGYDGIVEEIGIRSTRIRTLAGRVVTIPNSMVANEVVENITSEPTRRVVLELGLVYDTPADKMILAQELLKEIAIKDEGVDEEKTVLSFTTFGNFSLGIFFAYHIKKEADIMFVQNTMSLAILQQFSSNGLEFAFPTQTIHAITEKN